MASATLAERNAELIGIEGSRQHIDTPALILDLDRFEKNLGYMRDLAQKHGLGLRPHAKTHKCPQVAKRQVETGAIGLCCAKLAEAEAMADAGLDRLLVSSPIISPSKRARLRALHDRLDDLLVVVDDPVNVPLLAETAAGSGKPLRIVIDVDVGTHRFGVTSPAHAVEVARLVHETDGLQLMGVQGYAGHVQHIHDFQERAAASGDALNKLAAARDALVDGGLPCPIVTGGGSGSHAIDMTLGILSDIQVGSYIFMDCDYLDVAMTADDPQPLPASLFVACQVVSNRQGRFVTTDAGSKCFAQDGPPPRIARGTEIGAGYRMFGDQFGRVDLHDGVPTPPLGARFEVITPHCDPTMNLYDALHVMRGDTLVDIWRIARGGVS